MAIPSWLAGLTGANAFASNPANGFQATLGDALQGIGHSMMQNYRNGQGANPLQPNGTRIAPMERLGQPQAPQLSAVLPGFAPASGQAPTPQALTALAWGNAKRQGW